MDDKYGAYFIYQIVQHLRDFLSTKDVQKVRVHGTRTLSTRYYARTHRHAKLHVVELYIPVYTCIMCDAVLPCTSPQQYYVHSSQYPPSYDDCTCTRICFTPAYAPTYERQSSLFYLFSLVESIRQLFVLYTVDICACTQ